MSFLFNGPFDTGGGTQEWFPKLGGVSYQSESLAIFAAFSTPPDTTRKGVIDACVVALKNAGVWAKLDCLYMFAAADSQAALINWKTPGTFNASAVSSPTFTTDRGFAGNGSSSYVNTTFNPNTAGGAYVLNSAHLSVWPLTNSQASSTDIGGGAGGSDDSGIFPRGTGGSADLLFYGINDGISPSVANTDSSGLFVASRTASNAQAAYRNGGLLHASAGASSSLCNGSVTVGARHGSTQFSARQEAAASIGSGLTAADVALLYAAELNYMVAVGAASYETEANTVAAAFTTPPTATRKALINGCIKQLKDAGIWSKLDAFYVFAAADSQAALINWKNPGTFNASAVNSPTFTADRGFTGGGTAYVNTGLQPSTAGGVFTQNSAHVSARSLTSGTTGRPVGGTTSSAQRAVIIVNNGGNAVIILNDSTGSSWTNGVTDGHYIANRSASNARQGYRDGVSIGSDAVASAGNCDQTIRFDHDNGTSYALQIASGSIGSSLSATDAAALAAADAFYMKGVGAI